MSRHERFGTRSLAYSRWHRYALSSQEPMIDIDAVEYCHILGCSKPLVLIETARDKNQGMKPATVTRKLAAQSGMKALCVLYSISDSFDDQRGCACAPGHRDPGCDHGISAFRVRRLEPRDTRGWRKMPPDEYRRRLWKVRTDHIRAAHPLYEGGLALPPLYNGGLALP